MLKFRKMHDGASGPALSSPDDERFTRLGSFLARTKLDELPQLWNVLKGEMSLVGPRPEDPAFVELRREAYSTILEVRPGITGLSQLAFARESEVLDPDDRMGHYVEQASCRRRSRWTASTRKQRTLGMDMKILWWTLRAVVGGCDVAVHRDDGAAHAARAPDRRSRRAAAPPSSSSGRRRSDGELDLRSRALRDLLADVNGHVQMNGKSSLRDVQTVILAGGRGTRLAPYTSVLPKPLMPIGDQSILEVVVEQLEEAGIVDIHFCVGYLAHLIEAVFESRENAVTSTSRTSASRTRSELRPHSGSSTGLDSTFIVMNGDVLTTLDYRDLVAYHREQGNALTIATHKRSIKIDYGMLHLDVASRVQQFEEKPDDRLSREHGYLRDGAERARAHPRRRVLRLPRSRSGASRGGGTRRRVHPRRPLVRHRPSGGLRTCHFRLGRKRERQGERA